jgi:hypothetical protein
MFVILEQEFGSFFAGAILIAIEVNHNVLFESIQKSFGVDESCYNLIFKHGNPFLALIYSNNG